MRLVPVCLLTVLAYNANARTFDILIGGAKVGENTVTLLPNGTTESRLSLSVAGTKVTSELDYQFDSNGTVKSHRFLEAAGTTRFEGRYDGGQLITSLNGKQNPSSSAPKHSPPYFSSLHSSVLSSIKGHLIHPKGSVRLTNISNFTPLIADYEWVNQTAMIAGRVEPVIRVRITLAGTQMNVVFSPDYTVRGVQVPVQLLTMVEHGWEGLFVDPVTASKELSQLQFAVETSEKVMAPMRDGIKLASTITLPKGAGAAPTVLVRTPYGREGTTFAYSHFAQRGYNVVVQDTRGKGSSEGSFDPFMGEIEDGYDTIEWITKQPWSNGSVGMIGGSYLGYVQWAAAISKHPALKCIIPQVSPPEPTRNIPWDHGVFMLQPSLWWANIVRGQNADPRAMASTAIDPKSLGVLPLSKVDDFFLGKNLPFFDKWLKRPKLEDWKGAITQEGIGQVKIPALHVSGTWDGDGIGTLLNWQALRANSGNQWMVFGPWSHAFNTSTSIGSLNYGSDSVIDLTTLEVRFFDQFLKNKDVGMLKVPRVKIFASGANQWFSDQDLPLTFTTKQTVFLAGKSARGFRSSGALTPHMPAQGVDSFPYNPAKSNATQIGVDVGKLEAKEFPGEVVTYRTRPVQKSTLITGPFEVKLHAFTSVKDATFFAFLAEESPNGERKLLGQPGKMRTSFAFGTKVQPNRTFELSIQPWLFAHVLRPGSRLVLIITSDAFPTYARNPGTGEPDFSAKDLRFAVHSIRRGQGAPSSLSYYAYSW